MLSPSSSHRWLNCTASPLLEAKVPNVDTDFTKEGTLAHAHCAYKLKCFLSLPTVAEEEEMAGLEDYYTGEMDEHTETYVNIILDKLGETKERRYRDWETDRKSTRLNSSHRSLSRMPSSA